MTQWEMSFADFAQLLASSEARTPLNSLLGTWYGFSVIGDGEEWTVQSSIGAKVDPVTLHDWIQRDPDKQYGLYQMAMALWR